MKIEIEITSCKDCIYRKIWDFNSEHWEYCNHKDNGRGFDDKIICWKIRYFERTPEWCPLGLGKKP